MTFSLRTSIAALLALVTLGTASAQIGHQVATGEEARAARAKLAQHEAAYNRAKRAFNADPRRSAARRRALVEATVQFGATTMMSPVLTPQVKYPRALRLFREALRLDPNHAKAREYHDLIVRIYRSMGRPVPKG
jgi:tetratricopeptide (TPR) repeat protein